MTKKLLKSMRVLDLGNAESDLVSRLFADLGADVLKIEPPTGSAGRYQKPTVAGWSIPFAVHNANKRGGVLDPETAADRSRLIDLVSSADVVVDGGIPGGLAAFGTSCVALAGRFDHLVALSVTDFGSSGPHASWRGTDAVLYAMSTALSRSGPTSGAPVLPPLGIASATACVQAAWATLVAYYHRLRTGRGEYIDFSRFDGVVLALDPPFGSEGQAAAGRRPGEQLWRGRPRNQQIYPIIPCENGYVRICLLSPRQWRAMRAWLGEPDRFADPKFDTIGARQAASREINDSIAELFATQTMDVLVAEGQRRGVPIAAVLTAAQALSSDHFRAVGALVDIELAPGVGVSVPVGPFVVDGHRAGYTKPAPGLAADGIGWAAECSASSLSDRSVRRPFDGLRILDLGVIVAGGELGRMFADLGAEVIKIESAAYPDGLRQAPPGQVMSTSWALMHRNEYSFGLDLRHPSGAQLFERLVVSADAVFANFKPGTLASLGFAYERLREVNPRVVLAESSAFGATGPWSARMGYGPLVRATTGITWLWTSEDTSRGSFYDATTIFPDHVVARITAIAALAAIIDRHHSGTGAHMHISQAEAAVNQLATIYVAEAARAAHVPLADDPAIHAVYPCKGDDEWCVISLRSDPERVAMATAMGRAALPGDRAQLIAAVGEWTACQDKTHVTDVLQRLGIAAGPMNRADDVLNDPQLIFRNVLSNMTHPLFDAPMPTESGPAPYLHIPAAELRPAPMPGEHTREICQKVLAMDIDEINRLIAEGVLFTYQQKA